MLLYSRFKGRGYGKTFESVAFIGYNSRFYHIRYGERYSINQKFMNARLLRLIKTPIKSAVLVIAGYNFLHFSNCTGRKLSLSYNR